MSAFTREEYRRRVTAVQERVCERGLDVLMCHDLANICYLTGFQTIGSYGYGHYAAIVPASGEVTLFASDFESHNAKLYGSVDRIHVYRCLEDAVTGTVPLLADLLKKQGFGRARVGYESGHFSLTVGQFGQLTDLLPDATFVAVDELVAFVKLIKSSDEIAVMRRAARLTSDGHVAAQSVIAAGVSENDIAAAAYQAVIKGGGDYFSIQPIVTTGPRSGTPHSTFHRRRLESSDVVFIEIVASVDRYSSPAMRAVFVGEPPAEVRRVHEACFNSVRTLVGELRPHVNARNAARKARDAMNIDDLDLCWHGYYGYSVGIAFPPACSDCPFGGEITELHDFTPKPGMIFHCSTSLRKINQFGVTVGETVLITETGSEVLTKAPYGVQI